MIQVLSPKQAESLIIEGKYDVVDVREPNEWSTGHIANSRLVPLGELRSKPRDVLPRDGVIFVCARGVRSMTAAKIAESVGLSQLYSVDGGTYGWASAGLPLVRD
jgi:rhodanese-related sulfurtransferase